MVAQSLTISGGDRVPSPQQCHQKDPCKIHSGHTPAYVKPSLPGWSPYCLGEPIKPPEGSLWPFLALSWHLLIQSSMMNSTSPGTLGLFRPLPGLTTLQRLPHKTLPAPRGADTVLSGVYPSENPGVVISLEFNNDSFPSTFTGHIFGMRKNI